MRVPKKISHNRAAITKSMRRFTGLAVICTAVFAALSILPTWEKFHAYATVVEIHRGITKNGAASPSITIAWQFEPNRAAAMIPIGNLQEGDAVCIRYSLNRFGVPIRRMAVFDRNCAAAGVPRDFVHQAQGNP